MYKKSLLLPVILFFMGFLSARSSEILEYTAKPGNNYEFAEFCFWTPGNADHYQAVLALVPGWNWDGRPAVKDSVWQSFATEHNLALVSCYFKDKPHASGNPDVYCNVSRGSGQALLNAINDFAKRSDHPEIANAPLLLWGMSAGGQFNYEFTAWKPERVIAFVVNKGGYYHSALLSNESRQVPGLLFTGKKDQAFRQAIIKGLFATNRQAGALWALIEEPDTAHNNGRSRELALVFYKDMLKLRLPDAKENPGKQTQLLPLQVESGYLGDLESKTYCKFDDDNPPELPNAWLATEEIAKVWQNIITGVK